jgi:hypothetical protein
MTTFRVAAAALLLAATVRSARADDAKAKSAAPPQMSPAEQAMMEKYVKAATPGPEHQKLAKLAGKWKLEVTSWMAPGGPPMKSEATAEFTSILGGRFVQQEVHGDMGGGQPFEGRGVEGYDNVTKEHFGTWVDNMGTGAMVLRGKCSPDAKTCTYKGTMPDAIAGKQVPVSETMTFADDNHFKFEMQGPGPDGKTFKMLEISYTRQ